MLRAFLLQNLLKKSNILMCDKLSQKGYKMCVIKELDRNEIEQILDGFGYE